MLTLYSHIYTFSFLHYLQYMMLANVRLDVSGYKSSTFQGCRLQTSLVLLILKGKAKKKLAILAFMCGRGIV